MDDGSTDGSDQILDDYAKRDSRFVVVHKENEGVSAARNLALAKATGKWLTFIDADDWVEPTYLQELYSAVSTSGISVAVASVRKVCEDGGEEIFGPKVSGLIAPEDLYLKYNSLCAWSWGKLFLRSEWDGINYPEGVAYSEDRYILHRLLYPHPQIIALGNALYNYRIRSGSAIMSKWSPARLQVGQALMRQMEYFQENGFKRAEVFSAGLYLKWMPDFVVYLRDANQIVESEWKKEIRLLEQIYVQYFQRICSLVSCTEKIIELQPISQIRRKVRIALGEKNSRFRNLVDIVKYDGVIALLVTMVLRVKALIKRLIPCKNFFSRARRVIRRDGFKASIEKAWLKLKTGTISERYLAFVPGILLYFVSFITLRNNRKIVIGGWFGGLYGDNPKYFLQYVLEHTALNVVWIGKEKVKGFLPKNPRVRFVQQGTICAAWALLTTKKILCCHRTQWDFTGLPVLPRSLRRVRIVNTWHGIPIKKMGDEIPGAEKNVPRTIKEKITHFLSWRNEYVCVSSDKMGDILGRGWPLSFNSRRVLKCGTPRNDFLIEHRDDIALIRKIKEKYSSLLGFSPETKIVTYMPTWRSTQGAVRTFYSLQESEKEVLNQLLAYYNATMIEKHHYMTYVNNQPIIGSNNRFLAILPEQLPLIDTQELLLITDVLISDYSGAYIDYGLLQRPVIHYCYDYEFYVRKDTGLEYKLDEVAAGPIVKTYQEFCATLDRVLARPIFEPAYNYGLLVKYENGKACRTILQFLETGTMN